jgi:hypothetical protein
MQKGSSHTTESIIKLTNTILVKQEFIWILSNSKQTDVTLNLSQWAKQHTIHQICLSRIANKINVQGENKGQHKRYREWYVLKISPAQLNPENALIIRNIIVKYADPFILNKFDALRNVNPLFSA